MATHTEPAFLPAELDAAPEARAQNAMAWVANLAVLWDRRRVLANVAAIALLVNLFIAFLIPKRYESTARIMPPDSSSSSTAMLAALWAFAGTARCLWTFCAAEPCPVT
jgi:LPS O-antigen subunit length determinant protein (WzzB/FepE family)